MFVSLGLIVAGFFLLIKGSDYLVNGASSIAKRFGIPTLVIGLTIVALGTSTPELFVNVIASLNGASEIAIGNVLGSNFANILLVLGIAAVMHPIVLKSQTIWKEIPLSLLAVVLLAIIGSDVFFGDGLKNSIGRTDGLVLFAFFLVFLIYSFGIKQDKKMTEGVEVHPMSLFLAITSTIGGIIALALGGKFVVDGATTVAMLLHVSQNLIGLTIVAVGTSLPEMVSSIVAVRKGHPDLAIGNVIGSNIMNIFLILAASAVIHPLTFLSQNMVDVFVLMTATLFLFVTLFIGKRHVIERWTGVMFLCMYAGYIIFAVMRG